MFLTQSGIALKKRTFLRGSVPDRVWHSFDGRLFNIHLCRTLQRNVGITLGGERKSAVQQIQSENRS